MEKSLEAARRPPTGRLQRRSRRVSSDSKAVKTLGTLMGLFCVSWLPFFILYLVKPFCTACTVPVWIESAVTWLGYCNSFINPCVYAFLNRDFRSAFSRVLFCGRPVPIIGGRSGTSAGANQHRNGDCLSETVGRDCSVGKATVYRLKRSGFTPRIR